MAEEIKIDTSKLVAVTESFGRSFNAFQETELGYFQYLRSKSEVIESVSTAAESSGLTPTILPDIRERFFAPSIEDRATGRNPVDQSELDRAVSFVKENPNFPAKEPEEKLSAGALVSTPTKALIGEAGPEIVIPVDDLNVAVDLVYKKGSSAMLGVSAGFLSTMKPSGAQSKVMSRLNNIKTRLGLDSVMKISSGGGSFGLPNPIEWWNRGRNDRVKDENNASWGELWKDDNAQKGMSDEAFEKGEKAPLFGRPDQAFNPFRKKEKGGPGSGPTPMVRQVFERPGRALGDAVGGAAKNMRRFISPKGLMGAISNATEPARKRLNKSSVPTGQKSQEPKAIAIPPANGRDMHGARIILNPDASRAWRKAMMDAAGEGVDLAASVTSSFRSMAEQKELITRARKGDPMVLSPAAVGMSPHQQGWAVDISPASEANAWMRENGNKYGFRWQGKKDPVHFDFWNNSSNTKWLQPGKQKWVPDRQKGTFGMGGGSGQGTKTTLAEKGAGLVQKAGTLVRKAKSAMRFAKFGARFGPWGAAIGGLVGAVVGDPPDLSSPTDTSTGIGPDANPPDPSPMKNTVNTAPIRQESKGSQVVEIPIPIPFPQGGPPPMPSNAQEQVEDVTKHVIVDVFGKGTKEIYVEALSGG